MVPNMPKMIWTTSDKSSNKCKAHVPSLPRGFRSSHSCLPELHLSLVPTLRSHTPATILQHPFAFNTPLCSECPPISSAPESQRIQRLSPFHKTPSKLSCVFPSSTPLQHPMHTSTTVPRIDVYVPLSCDYESPKSRDCVSFVYLQTLLHRRCS